MGNKVTRRRDTPDRSAETAATEQKPAEEPAQESEVTQTQEAAETENVDVVVGEPVMLVPCLPSEECVSEFKEVASPAATEVTHSEPKPVAKETPAPEQPELLLSVSKTPPKSEPVVEAQLASEPEHSSNPEIDTEVVVEPISEPLPAPAEALDKQTDMLTQESLPKPVISSTTLINLGVPDETLQPANTPPSPAPIHHPVNTDEPLDERQGSAEAAEVSMFEPEKPKEISDSQEKAVEATENLDQLVSDVNDDSISGPLKNLELQGHDNVTDLVSSDVKIPDDTPITDICTSTELM